MTKNNCIKLGDEVITVLSKVNQSLLEICGDQPTVELATISGILAEQMIKLLDIMKRESAPYLTENDDIPNELFTQSIGVKRKEA